MKEAQIKIEYKGKLKAEEFIDHLRGRVVNMLFTSIVSWQKICH